MSTFAFYLSFPSLKYTIKYYDGGGAGEVEIKRQEGSE